VWRSAMQPNFPLRMRRLLVGAIYVVATAGRVFAVDYDKIDRALTKEPSYKSGAPKYALLLFGPRAKPVWLVIDGDTAYVDRNGDGDLTADDERIDDFATRKNELNTEIADPDAHSKYAITRIGKPYSMGQPPVLQLSVYVDVVGPAKYRQYSDTPLEDSPKQVRIAHFAGPLTAGPRTINWKLSPKQSLHLGGSPNRVDAVIGTMDESHRCCSDDNDRDKPAFPLQFPVATIEFPPKMKDGSRVTQSYPLEKFCCGAVFYTNVETPADAGVGTAKITYSFDAWPEGHVSSSTVEMPVISAEEAKKQADEDAAAAKQTESK
jgi:hypothetical protein